MEGSDGQMETNAKGKDQCNIHGSLLLTTALNNQAIYLKYFGNLRHYLHLFTYIQKYFGYLVGKRGGAK